jgi:hypothetical protein
MNNIDPRYEALRELEREAFDVKQKVMFARGKIIVITIAVFFIIFSIACFFVSLANFNGLTLIVSFIYFSCAIHMIKRSERARYVVIAVLILSSVVTFVFLGAISPDFSRHSQNVQVQVMYDPITGQFYGVPMETLLSEISNEPVSPLYIVLSVLLAAYIICAALLIFSKNVKVYMGESPPPQNICNRANYD